jgi:aminopeptidase N
VLAHELVHQWIPAVIGSNNNRHNFLSESLASHLALLALGTMRDETQASEYLATDIAAPYLAMLDARGDGVVDDPVASTSATADRVALVYGKGVLGFEAIRQQIGTEAYLRALNAYAEDFRFGVSRPTDLQAAFEEAAGQDLSVPWHTWFSSATTTATDVAEVVEGFATPPDCVPQDRRFPRAMAPRVPVPGCQNGANGDNLSQIVRAFRTGDSP